MDNQDIQDLNGLVFFDSGETQIAESHTQDTTYFDLAYGLSDKLTVSLSAPYVKKTLIYHDDYITEYKAVQTALGSSIITPPKEAKGHGLGDLKIGAKYNFNKNLALGLSYQGGLLKTGNDATELKTLSDNQEQLSTGYKSDFTTLALYYDLHVGAQTISFLTAYEHSSRGYEKTLDNDFDADPGNTFSIQVDSDIKVGKYLELAPSLTYLQTAYDEKKDATTGNWNKIHDSESAATLAGIKLTYKPYIFLNTWISYNKTISEKISRGMYDYPGRLYIPEIISFGITVYAK